MGLVVRNCEALVVMVVVLIVGERMVDVSDVEVEWRRRRPGGNRRGNMLGILVIDDVRCG